MKTSIILTTTEEVGGKKRKRSFSDINPNATNTELKNFAQAINALTTNNYGETNRVDTTNVDTEGSRKSSRNIQITNASQGQTATITVNINIGETVNPAVFFYNNSETAQILPTTTATSDNPNIAKFTITIPQQSGTVFAGLIEKNDFLSDFVSATVN